MLLRLHSLNIVEWNVVRVDWQRYIHVLVAVLLGLRLGRRHGRTGMLLVLEVRLRLLIIYHRRTEHNIMSHTCHDYLHILVGICARSATRVLSAGHERHRALLWLLETHGWRGLERHLVCGGNDTRTDREG